MVFLPETLIFSRKIFFGRGGRGYGFCNSGAPNMVGSSPEKLVRDLVTSAQRDIFLNFFCEK